MVLIYKLIDKFHVMTMFLQLVFLIVEVQYVCKCCEEAGYSHRTREATREQWLPTVIYNNT